MRQNKLGTSDIEISELSFGCMSLQLEQGQTAVSTLLWKAFEQGITFFDTADLYDKGVNEKMVGEAVKPFRDKITIATKVGNVWNKDRSGWNWNPSKTLILSAVHESLRRLQTDYIDLYQLHGGTIEDPINEIIEAFEILKAEGKIRAYGISSIRPNVIREYAKKSNIDSVMMQYSLLDRRPEEEMLDLLASHSISVITRGTLAKGLLIDKKAKDYLSYPAKKVAQMQKAANKTNNPISAAIQYVLQHPAVASAVLGIRTQKQLSEAIKAQNKPVPADDLHRLAKQLNPKKYQNHR
jgi:aryl-alcohol dehydrogenase-like predicted oxidoreductase